MVQDIIESLKTFSDSRRKDKMKTYAATSMEIIGVSNPHARKVADEVHKQLKNEPDARFITLAVGLVETNIFECQSVAWFLLEKQKGLIQKLSQSQMKLLQGTMDNWASVDGFGVMIYGALWKVGTVSDDQVMKLTMSDNFWFRRLALVATVCLNLRSRGGEGDSARTIMVCEALAADHEEMIEKALSWALRTLINWDRRAVESFLDRHEKVLGSRVKREVRHKLEHGTKN